MIDHLGTRLKGSDHPSDIDFPYFFRTAFSGNEPFRWQKELVDSQWPEVLVAPTGSGKTAGITLGWLYKRLISPTQTPRRLVWCLPMRSLVDQTFEAITSWVEGLCGAQIEKKGLLPTPRDVYILKGGTSSNDWLSTPERSAIIVGTQDMLLSRALMRGYASSYKLWPMQFGLLHLDVQWIFDEVQLMGSGRATSAQLEAFRREDLRGKDSIFLKYPTHSLWVSATLEPEWLATVDFPAPLKILRVNPADETDKRVRNLVCAPKHLSRSDVFPQSSTAKHEKVYIEQLTSTVLNAHQTQQMTLVIVNQVARAQSLYQSIQKTISKNRTGPQVVLLHSRFRSAEQKREMLKITSDHISSDKLVIATQAIEAGIDISASVMFTELAPWASMVQRFGRANRRAEVSGGAQVYWVDLLRVAETNAAGASKIALPYDINELENARQKLLTLRDAAPIHLPSVGSIDSNMRVLRRKDLDDLFDTDADLNGFHVDISMYVRDANDTDLRVFWRSESVSSEEIPVAKEEELCAVPIGQVKKWIEALRKAGKSNLLFVRDTLFRRRDGQDGISPIGWKPLRQSPWPGLTLLVDTQVGGYSEELGFTGRMQDVPQAIILKSTSESRGSSPNVSDGHDEDTESELGCHVSLKDHLDHVTDEVSVLSKSLGLDHMTEQLLVRAARWHDLGKAHEVFQSTMRRGLDDPDVFKGLMLAKSDKHNLRHDRLGFRHELASMLALMAYDNWSRDSDLLAYLIAAHHGNVRMNIRALPKESVEDGVKRFARGIWEGDELPALQLGGRDSWPGGPLTLSVMELGYDKLTKESWTERTRDLLQKFGPFKMAFLESLLRIADWRASKKEEEEYG